MLGCGRRDIVTDKIEIMKTETVTKTTTKKEGKENLAA